MEERDREPPAGLRRAYDPISRGDFDAAVEKAEENVEIVGCRSTQEMANRPAEKLRLVDEWRWAPDEILLEEGDTVVVRASITGRSRAGVPIDPTVFHVIRTEGDKVASFRGFFDRAAAVEAVGPSE